MRYLHNKGLTPATIAGGVNTFDAGRVSARGSLNVGSGIRLQAQLLDDLLLRTEETQRQETELGREELLKNVLHESGRNVKSERHTCSDPAISSMLHFPPFSVHSTRTVFKPFKFPSSSSAKLFVEMQYSRGSLAVCAITSECP